MEDSQRASQRALGAAEELELEGLFFIQTPQLAQKRRSQGRIICERFVRHRAAAGGAAVLVLLFVLCFVGPLVSGHTNPNAIQVTQPFAPPSWAFPFGADDVGRDMLARAMAGGQVSLEVGLASMLMAIVVGVGVGSFAGYYGGLIDNILMRVTDIMLAVPTYLLLFVLSAGFTNGTQLSVIVLIAIFGWTTSARLIRGEFLAHKEREYVQVAKSIGVRDLRLMFVHILPNAAGPIIVNATLLVGNNIVMESVLSYFGFGVKPPIASWGSMMYVGQSLLERDGWLVIVPGVLIVLTVLSCNLVGDGLRDALDPQMTQR